MENNPPSGPTEKNSVRGGLSNGPSFRRPPGARPVSATDGTSPHANHLPFQQVTITVYKDEKGYGMKVSGDNPVYVQSVKEGGAAERAGLHSGDKIIKVNGVNVTHSTHTEVVELIKSAPQVVLTVQQRCASHVARSPTGSIASPGMARSPLQHHHSAPSRDRITGPQPVDGEKKRQVEYERVHTLQLMLEKEQRFVDGLRSELAKTNDIKKQEQLAGAERRVQTLQQQLLNLSSHYEQEPLSPRHADPDVPPPLPSRNPVPLSSPQSPPPLPPRQYLLVHSESVLGTVNSNIAGPAAQTPTHHRTKSNPDTMSAHNLSLAEAGSDGELSTISVDENDKSPSKRLIASESMSELHFAKRSKGGVAWDVDSPRITPPGTPPPPYGGAGAASPVTEDSVSPALDENDTTRGEPPPGDISPNPGLSPQPPIISMEEDESDQEMSQLEDHGPFKSLSKLWNSHAHLAVFMNYVISNSEPSSLLFYLVTDLYKVGNAKEMKKWAYEIHSSFLVPGAPLRLANVDENIAREVDDVLQNESDKEEILRKVFWKARNRAKEDLNEQLADFQQKRTAGLGTLFGPPDSVLDESIHDKGKEIKIVESILLPKLEPFLEEIDKDVVDDRRFTTGAALGTVMGKVFGVRSQSFSSMLDRCPTFVSKDKSLKAKLLGKSRKVTARGHHFVAHHYYTVTYCNHCQLIIWGIGPQGYQCSDCGLNIHRACVKVLDESCPGPMVKKEKGNDRISKLMERIMPEQRRKPSSLNLAHAERVRRQQEEAENTDTESGERTVSGSRVDRRPDPVSEERAGSNTHHPHLADHDDDPAHHEQSHHVTKTKPSATSINRSESYKDRIHQKRQLRERRKTSDPNLSKSNNDVDVENQALSYHSGSSSNSSLSTRSLDSPSNSLEAVSGGRGPGGEVTPWDSDTEADVVDPPDWKNTVPEDILRTLTPHEIKRQEVINELFMTERSHVRGLKVLDRVFYRPMKEQQVLPQEQIQLLFSNLEEMLEIHSRFNNSMKAKRKEGPVIGEIGDLLYSMFEGTDGEHFQEAAAVFCRKQQIALEALKEKRRKDAKLNSFLSDAEGNPVCRRLQLKDIIPSGMFRLTKYPLLLKNLEKYTTAGTEEAVRVTRAEERSREILNYVNTAVKEAEDQYRLAEIQRRLDRASFDKVDHAMAHEFRNLDLTRHRLIHEGPLNWRIANRPKPIDLHVLLLEDIIILLQKQDDKYVLKYYSSTLSPVIRVSTVIVRPNAVDKKALFLVNTAQSGAQIYDLVASSNSEKRLWFKHISDAAEAYKTREGKHRRQDTSTHEDNHDKTKESEESGASNSELLSAQRADDNQSDAASPTLLASSETTPQASPSPQHPDTPEPPSRKSGEGLSPSPVRRVAEPLRQTTAESCLIEPTEVVICQSPVLTAEPVLTPLEKLRRTDERIRESLEEKRHLVAEILHVPPAEYDTISDMAAEPSHDKEPQEILLALSNQANKLTSVINEYLQVTEEEAVTASRAVEERQRCHLPSVPAHVLQQISSQFNSQLTLLMSVMKTREEERVMFRHENQRSREQLHAVYERQPAATLNTSTDNRSTDNRRSMDLEPVDIGAACIETQSMPQDEADKDQNSAKIPTTPEVFVDALSGETEESVAQ
ncbi:rho guanine nucleotide exchange factor 12 [Macrosteles quadrilineatus]|uniref:rho guanine nucleotide exchange factor 12 n=1 Tax=Macrosteles quadrilineatus TaxID=74068 RepID=UPI0023E0B9F0|nr:rho guanine nucleotide exchange factor 12 [Macrosteles quadrilineatus]